VAARDAARRGGADRYRLDGGSQTVRDDRRARRTWAGALPERRRPDPRAERVPA
jgi:hypothetical protein